MSTSRSKRNTATLRIVPGQFLNPRIRTCSSLKVGDSLPPTRACHRASPARPPECRVHCTDVLCYHGAGEYRLGCFRCATLHRPLCEPWRGKSKKRGPYAGRYAARFFSLRREWPRSGSRRGGWASGARHRCFEVVASATGEGVVYAVLPLQAGKQQSRLKVEEFF